MHKDAPAAWLPRRNRPDGPHGRHGGNATAVRASRSHGRWPYVFTLCAALLLGLLTALLPLPALAADEDPPGRVGRIAELGGRVSIWDNERGNWDEALRNRVITRGDRINTDYNGRAELRVGTTVLRLAGGTELEVLRLDDDRLFFHLHAGSVALRVRSREIADEIELHTAEGRFAPQRAGHYRLDRNDDVTQASTWRGEMRVLMPGGFEIESGQSVELTRERREAAFGGGFEIRQRRSLPPEDAFTAYVLAEDRRSDRLASTKYVSPEMTGAEELDRHGRWERHPEFGPLWIPLQVSVGWAPYRQGRWAWVRPWGWTWIDAAPWGFAVSHYGRWVPWRGGWGWVPGAYVSRPVFAPALVAWTGGSNWSVSIGIGAPPVAWVPLAPRDPYRPWYRHTPVYVERVNPQPPYRWHNAPSQGQAYPGPMRPYPHQPVPGQVPTGPIMYGNQGTPSAVQTVPRDVLRQGEGGAAVSPGRPATAVVPPAVVGPMSPAQMASPRPVPGGAEPVPAPAVRAPEPAGRTTEGASREAESQRPRHRGDDGVVDLRREQYRPQMRPPVPPTGAAAPVVAPERPAPERAAPVRAPAAVAAPAPEAERKQRPERPERSNGNGREREMTR